MEEKKQKQSNKLPMLILFVLIAAVAIVMTMRQMHTSGESTTCDVVPQSAFGQAPSQSWVEMKSAKTAEIGAGFALTYPQDQMDVDYDSVQYWSYTQRINEHRYYKADKEVFRIAKGRMCGQPLYTPDSPYASTVIADVNGNEVTEYGDGTMVTAVSWTNGAYSYFVGMFGNPMSREEAEAFISEVN